MFQDGKRKNLSTIFSAIHKNMNLAAFISVEDVLFLRKVQNKGTLSSY